MANRQILVEILGNSKGFTTATEEATTSAGKFQNVLTGIGQGIGQAGFAAVSQAISGVTDYLTGSLAAAEKDQLSMAQLGQTLKANVPAWDGNQQAIEDYIVSAEKASAFSKDDLRASLNLLVGATHDVTKAENDQTIATNLARYKNIDLASATQLIVQAEAGRYRGLAALGISVKGVTSSTEALAKISQVVAGQDTSYLGTEAGQMQVLTNQIDDLQVELGQKLMPVFKTMLQFINSNLIPTIGFLSSAWDSFLNVISQGGSKALEKYNKQQDLAQSGAGKLTGTLGQQTLAIKAGGAAFVDLTGRIHDSVEQYSYYILNVQRSTTASIDAMYDRITTRWSALESMAQGVADAIWGPQERGAALAATKAEEATQRQIIASKKSTAAQVADAKRQLLTLESSYEQQAIVMAGRGQLNKTEYAALIAELTKQAKSADTDVATAAKEALAQLKALKDYVQNNKISNFYGGGKQTGPGAKHNASGGPLSAGDVSWVGEEGPELFVAPSNGNIIPNNKIGPMSSGGGTTIININGGMFMDPTSLDKLAALLDGRKRLRQI